MEHEKLTILGRSGYELKHPSRGIGPDDEDSVVGIDEADSVGHCVSNRLVADAVAPSRASDPHRSCVPHYRETQVDVDGAR